ncbi:unnamed protein product [Mytilus edulis]|uniref:Uncharacterized protein n=1 Tax=Mytilus edulis TaxID=6550 RepID=A0A8S3PSQ2_MYTED|nr:unnamed protein product [Mytilus edulis]
MAANMSCVYKCSDCKRFYEDLEVFNGHKCVLEGDPTAMLTQIQNEQLGVGEDIEEDKRRTMFTCDDCSKLLTLRRKYAPEADVQEVLRHGLRFSARKMVDFRSQTKNKMVHKEKKVSHALSGGTTNRKDKYKSKLYKPFYQRFIKLQVPQTMINLRAMNYKTINTEVVNIELEKWRCSLTTMKHETPG